MPGFRLVVLATTLSLLPLSPAVVDRPAGAVTSVRVGQFGIDVLGTNVILRPDGSQVPLRLPQDTVATMAAAVPTGWVVSAREPGGPAYLSLFPVAGGAGKRISAVGTNWMVSPDGGLVVIAGTGDQPADKRKFLAVELPSLRVLARAEVPSEQDLSIIGTAPDQVVLSEHAWDGPAKTAVWNLRTGQVAWSTTPVWAWNTTAGGWLFARWDTRLGRRWAPRKAAVRSCVALAPVPAGSVQQPRWCTQTSRGIIDGLVSPSGTAAAVRVATNEFESFTTLVTMADLLAGRWRPATLPAAVSTMMPEFWAADGAAIFRSTSAYRAWRCLPNGACSPLDLPRLQLGQTGPQLVPRYGPLPQ